MRISPSSRPRDFRLSGLYLTRRGPVKGLFCFKRTTREQALQQATLKSRDSTLLLPLPTTGLGLVFPVLVFAGNPSPLLGTDYLVTIYFLTLYNR